jgi:hypothetical protein
VDDRYRPLRLMYVVKIWGKESNLKRRGGGEESKFIEEYTPLLVIYY